MSKIFSSNICGFKKLTGMDQLIGSEFSSDTKGTTAQRAEVRQVIFSFFLLAFYAMDVVLFYAFNFRNNQLFCAFCFLSIFLYRWRLKRVTRFGFLTVLLLILMCFPYLLF